MKKLKYVLNTKAKIICSLTHIHAATNIWRQMKNGLKWMWKRNEQKKKPVNVRDMILLLLLLYVQSKQWNYRKHYVCLLFYSELENLLSLEYGIAFPLLISPLIVFCLFCFLQLVLCILRSLVLTLLNQTANIFQLEYYTTHMCFALQMKVFFFPFFRFSLPFSYFSFTGNFSVCIVRYIYEYEYGNNNK